jgi:hypothetical protein
MNYMPWLTSNHMPLISASQVVRITGMSHQGIARKDFHGRDKDKLSPY